MLFCFSHCAWFGLRRAWLGEKVRQTQTERIAHCLRRAAAEAVKQYFPSRPSPMLREGDRSSCAGQRAIQPPPARRTAFKCESTSSALTAALRLMETVDRSAETLRGRARARSCVSRPFESASVLLGCSFRVFSAREHTSRWRFSDRRRVCLRCPCGQGRPPTRTAGEHFADFIRGRSVGPASRRLRAVNVEGFRSFADASQSPFSRFGADRQP